MTKIPFEEKELNVIGHRPPLFPEFPPIPIYDRPISGKENLRRLYESRTPLWNPQFFNDTIDFTPSIIADNVARAFVFSGENFDNEHNGGGPDMYGTPWVYEPTAGGSMVVPGNPRIQNMNDWRKIITLPDVDSWDWEGCAKVNSDFVKQDMWMIFTILTGYFERLISLMDFEGAAMALIDEEQEDALHDFFSANTDVLCKIVDKVAEYFPEVDCITVHDDWGSQRAPFFSQDTAMEMIVPHMKRLVDHIHAKGFYADMHSCGHTEDRIEAYIAAGWDSWCPQEMNDTVALHEQYGDRIMIIPTPPMPADMTEEEETEMAKALARKFAQPGKAVMYGLNEFSEHMDKEVYRYARLELLK